MAVKKILILGGGIAGIGSALALASQEQTKDIEIEIFELRSEPSALGGAINLTPNVLRYLSEWGVTPRLQQKGCEIPRIELYAMRTGKVIGTIDYDKPEKFGYRALRVHRWELLESLLDGLKEVAPNAIVYYGKTATNITSTPDSIRVDFADGSSATGDILLGCDGIHSFARQSFVDPERKPVYTQIAVCNGFADSSVFTSGTPPFATTALFTGHLGSFMLSYHDPEKKKVYAAAVSQREDAGDRDGWKLRAKDQEGLNQDIVKRFTGTPNKCIDDFLAQAHEWTLFPVYKLENGGNWFKERCLLLGDAAHAVSFPCLHILSLTVTRCHPRANPSCSVSKTEFFLQLFWPNIPTWRPKICLRCKISCVERELWRPTNQRPWGSTHSRTRVSWPES
jgi:2-polyprenyl-6-methoxyphenol hydroxylase-like FAD-dependent oxidoreductase